MTGRPVILVATALTLSAAGAIAADPPATSQEERQICRGSTKQLGSRIRRPRRCRTAEQWRQEDEEKGRVPCRSRLPRVRMTGGRPPRRASKAAAALFAEKRIVMRSYLR